MTRREGELVRLREQLDRMRACVESVEIALRCDGPVGLDTTQALTNEAVRVATTAARHDAYWWAENENK